MCFDCKEVIGGINYILERSNQFVFEMDGVQYVVWFDMVNNLMNFEEIQRMMQEDGILLFFVFVIE